MEMVKVKVLELTGRALDWALIKAIGAEASLDFFEDNKKGLPAYERYSPSTDWKICGPLIEKYSMLVSAAPDKPLAIGRSQKESIEGLDEVIAHGETALQAVCRCLVGMFEGDETEVPAVLIKDGE